LALSLQLGDDRAMPTVERRKNRSSSSGVAAQLYLEALAARCRLTDLVLSDESGLLVAGTSSTGDADEIAAMTPFFGGRASAVPWHDRGVEGMETQLSELYIGPARCFLLALGGRVDPAEARRTLGRIFAC
jgi:hypothetical protein